MELSEQEERSLKLRDFWMKEVERETKAHKKYRDRARKVFDKYKDEREEKDNAHRFNIFWSNVEVIKGAIYSATPKPEVRRRFLDRDPLARNVAEVMERALSYCTDNTTFEDNLDLSITDYLVPGLGTVRLRYTPYFEKGEPPTLPVNEEKQENGTIKYFLGDSEIEKESVRFDDFGQPYTFGEAEDELVYQEVTEEPVAWDRFRWQPAARWEDVRWTCIDHYLTKEELIEQFEEKGRKCGLTHVSEGKDKVDDEKDRALVHEIFDKKTRRIIVVSPGLKEEPLSVSEDGLGLEDFFPHPKPLMASTTTDKLEPMPDYLFYQDQARELNKVTERINGLMEQLKVRGIYDGSFKELANLLNTGEGDLTPVEDFAERFGDTNRGLESVVHYFPIEKIAPVVKELYSHREMIKQEIYEITGIADIMRGASKASETLGAQQMKRQFGSMRIANRQRKVSSFIRDIFRLKAEIIAEHFEADTLSLMTGIEVTDGMLSLMRNDMMRGYKIDVESDSTIAKDEIEEQESRIKMMTSLTQMMERVVPAVQSQIIPLDVAKELVLFGIRAFKAGRTLEDKLEQIGGDSQDEDPRLKQMQQTIQQGQQMIGELQKEIKSRDSEYAHKEKMRIIEQSIKVMEAMKAEIGLNTQKTGEQLSLENMIQRLTEVVQKESAYPGGLQ